MKRHPFRHVTLWVLWSLLLFSAWTVQAEESRPLSFGAVKTPAPYPGSTGDVDASFASPPSAYSSAASGFVTPVKSQSPYGTCSYFATIAAIESSAARNGVLSASGLDLSEYHLLYFLNHRVKDPLGGTAGDKTEVQGDVLQAGGNIIFNGFHLLSWSGPATEKQADFRNPRKALSKSLAYRDALHVQDMILWPMSDPTGIKRLIQSCGAVAVAYYHAPSYFFSAGDPRYFNEDTGAYYFNSRYESSWVETPNHAVALIGWDDHYSRGNFPEGNRPSRDGAWLAKNQWGSEFGLGGYFWISYEDTVLHCSAADFTNLAVAFQVEKADNYNFNYQYDGGTGISFTRPFDKITAANLFTPKGSKKETLKAVGFAVYTEKVKYSIQIYKNPKTGKPFSGKKLLKKAQTGTLSGAGYHTVKLNTPVKLKKGDRFSVAVTIRSGNGDASFMVDQSIPARYFRWVKVTASQKKRQSYINAKVSGRTRTVDTASSSLKYTPRIKAYTDKR